MLIKLPHWKIIRCVTHIHTHMEQAINVFQIRIYVILVILLSLWNFINNLNYNITKKNDHNQDNWNLNHHWKWQTNQKSNNHYILRGFIIRFCLFFKKTKTKTKIWSFLFDLISFVAELFIYFSHHQKLYCVIIINVINHSEIKQKNKNKKQQQTFG